MVDAVAAGAWPEKENQNASRINQIYEHVKQVRTHGGVIPDQSHSHPPLMTFSP